MGIQRIAIVLVIVAVLAGASSTWLHVSGAQLHVSRTASTAVDGLDLGLMHRVEITLAEAGIEIRGMVLDPSGVTVRFADSSLQASATRALNHSLGSSFTVTAVASSPTT